MIREKELNKASMEYGEFRKRCGVKDPILLDEVEEAYYAGGEWADKTMLEKIETEIKRRKQSWRHTDKQYVAGGRDMCDYLLGYIETLKNEI